MALLWCQKILMPTEPWWLSRLACQSIAIMYNAQGQGFKSTCIHFEIGLFQFSKCMLWIRANLSFSCIICTKILYGHLETLRNIQSILVTINTHGYDILIWIRHRPQSLQDWGEPQEQLHLKVPSGQSPNWMSWTRQRGTIWRLKSCSSCLL